MDHDFKIIDADAHRSDGPAYKDYLPSFGWDIFLNGTTETNWPMPTIISMIVEHQRCRLAGMRDPAQRFLGLGARLSNTFRPTF